MKIVVALSFLAGIAATNRFASQTERSANDIFTAKLVKEARRLNGESRAGVDLSTYAMKFEKCVNDVSEVQLADKNVFVDVEGPSRFVIFGLCPTTNCSTTSAANNCDKYMIDLNGYLDITVAWAEQDQQEYCNACSKECSPEGEGDPRGLTAVDCISCSHKCSKIQNMEANGYLEASLFRQCQMIFDPDDDSRSPLYAGPICDRNGTKINFLVFKDDFCDVLDESKSLDDYLVNEVGNTMLLSHALTKQTYSDTCIPCAREAEDDGVHQAAEMCQQLSQDATSIVLNREEIHPTSKKSKHATKKQKKHMKQMKRGGKRTGRNAM